MYGPPEIAHAPDAITIFGVGTASYVFASASFMFSETGPVTVDQYTGSDRRSSSLLIHAAQLGRVFISFNGRDGLADHFDLRL